VLSQLVVPAQAGNCYVGLGTAYIFWSRSMALRMVRSFRATAMGELCRLSGCSQPLIEAFDVRIAPHGVEGRHIEGIAANTTNTSLFRQRATCCAIGCGALATRSGAPMASSKMSSIDLETSIPTQRRAIIMGPVPVMRGLLAQPRATVQVEVIETGGRPSRLTASCARDPTASRPPHHDRIARHRDP